MHGYASGTAGMLLRLNEFRTGQLRIRHTIPLVSSLPEATMCIERSKLGVLGIINRSANISKPIVFVSV